MRIALYGGAFNPVHNEHVNIVKAAKEELGLDKIIIIPTAISPHKRTTMTARGRERLEACKLAFGNISGAEVSDCELKRGGVSYSYVTCRHFRKLYKDDELYFIVGADMLRSFHLWREPEEILKCVTLAACARENAEELGVYAKEFHKRFKAELVTFGYVGRSVSSTKIRALAALGEDTAEFVPESVRNYIRSKALYEIPCVKGVKKYLTEERWQHTMRVAQTAAEHARLAGVYEYDAVIAAALHDCAKYLSPQAEELKGFVPPENIPAPVIHQFAGAFVAEHTFGIKDGAVLNAIRYHTTGRENMSGLEKLIFLSDLLEDGRDFDGVEKLRKKFARDIDGCLYSALENQLKHLNETGAQVCSLTKRAFGYLKENYDE